MKKTITSLLVLGLMASVSWASQFEAFDRASQVRESELILVGRVLSTRSEWTPNRSAIVTDAVVAIEEVWKGLPASDRVTVRTLAGTVDGVTLEVEGAARFTEGEEVMVFLDEVDGHFVPWGMRFGKYSVVESDGEVFLVGALPPSITGAQKFVQVSIASDDLHDEVRSILGE